MVTDGRQLAEVAVDGLEGFLELRFGRLFEQVELQTDAGLGTGQIMHDPPKQLPSLLSRRVEASQEGVDALAQQPQGGDALIGQQGQRGGG